MSHGLALFRRPVASFRRPVASAAAFLLVCGAAATCGAVTATAATAGSSAGPAAWGLAQPIPGLAALLGTQPGSPASSDSINAVTCAAPGDCVIGGNTHIFEGDVGYENHAFVISESNGVWGEPLFVGGGDGYQSSVNSVACASPGNCVAAGYDSVNTVSTGYVLAIGAFIASEADGVWGASEQVPGTTALNQGDNFGEVSSVSCPAPGDCAVTGYIDNQSEFVDSETNGAWGTAQLVPGYSGTSTYGGDNSEFWSDAPVISCSQPGDCVVAGNDNDTASGAEVTSVATEANGTWGSSGPLPGIAAGGGAVTSVDCTASGDCTAGGWTDSGKTQLPFVAGYSDGTWTSQQVPGLAALSSSASGGSSQVAALSCTAPGDCVAGGGFQASASDQGAFIADEVNGSWQAAREVPGTKPAPNAPSVSGISCTASGDCSAILGSDIVDETNGTWGLAYPVAGPTGGQVLDVISCAAPDACLAVGNEYLVAKSAHAVTRTAATLSAAKVTYGHEQTEKVSATVAATTPAPPGTVTVTSGKTRVCAITLSSGKGGCAVPAALFARGIPKLTASYGGGPGFAASSSATVSFTVVKAASKTALTLSEPRAAYGQEQREKLTVRVAPQYIGRPSGKVTVAWRGVTVCVITLAKAAGSCTLAPEKLTPGSRTLVAKYAGDGDFNGSSAARTLTIAS
jgi:hypothetical protein